MAVPDAIVVGAGPNGLSAAIALARAGCKVVVYEAQEAVGGGCRSAELTLPGFVHDVCSAVHPRASRRRSSGRCRSPITVSRGWIRRPCWRIPSTTGRAGAIVERDRSRHRRGLGGDAAPTAIWSDRSADWPRSRMRCSGRRAFPGIRSRWRGSASARCRRRNTWPRHVRGERARGLFAGIAAHGMLPLESCRRARSDSCSAGSLTRRDGPFPAAARRGSPMRCLVLAVARRRDRDGTRVTRIEELPPAKAILCDLSPRPFLRIAERSCPVVQAELEVIVTAWAHTRSIGRSTVRFRGATPSCARRNGAPRRDTRGNARIGARDLERRDFRTAVRLLVQPSLFDVLARRRASTRVGRTATCHGHRPPTCCRAIEAQIERFAPGFRERVLARHVMTPADLERRNPNLVGGDIGMGITDVWQMVARPTWRWYRTPRRDSICVRPQPRRASRCMGCADTTRPDVCCGMFSGIRDPGSDRDHFLDVCAATVAAARARLPDRRGSSAGAAAGRSSSS